jgi:hypothetical protein
LLCSDAGQPQGEATEKHRGERPTAYILGSSPGGRELTGRIKNQGGVNL